MSATATLPGQDGTPQKFVMTAKAVEINECIAVQGQKMTWRESQTQVSAKGAGPMQAEADRFIAKYKNKVNVKVKDALNNTLKSDEPESLPFVFPRQPMKPGYSWKATGKLFGAPSTVTYRFTGVETVMGKAAAVITLSPDKGVGNLRVVSPIRYYVEIATGWSLKAVGTLDMEPQAGIHIQIALAITRV